MKKSLIVMVFIIGLLTVTSAMAVTQNSCDGWTQGSLDAVFFQTMTLGGREVSIYKTNPSVNICYYENFCESAGKEWYAPLSPAEADNTLTTIRAIDEYHTWIINKADIVLGPSGVATWNGQVLTTIDNPDCSESSLSGFSAIRDWGCSMCDPEQYGVTSCWDTHDYDWILCEGTYSGSDTDNDGVYDDADNCVNTANADQLDADNDELGNACDNCVNTANSGQADDDNDGLGNACDAYNCIATGSETCDTLDNDCDGLYDEDDVCAVVETTCITVSGCVDGSDYLYLNNGELSLSHITAAVMGDHGDCPDEYMYKIYVDDVAHNLDYYNEGYHIDGNSYLDVDILNIESIAPINYRGGITQTNQTTIFLDDDAPEGAYVYTVEICGMPNDNNNEVPEFSVIAGAVALIGALAIFIVRRRH